MAGMQFDHGNDAEQPPLGCSPGRYCMQQQHDSMLFQHYADMDRGMDVAQPDGVRNLLQADAHVTTSANFDMDQAMGGKTCFSNVAFVWLTQLAVKCGMRKLLR